MYEELVKRLKDKAERFDYDGWVDTAVLMEKAAYAIEELTKDLERSKEWESFWQKEANEALRKFQVAVANKPRWVPVTERLPHVGETVWAVYSNSLFPGKSWHKTLKYDGEIWIDENGYRYLPANITHWQERDPLPEQPKEEV